MGCDLRGCNFSSLIGYLADFDIHYCGSFSHHIKFYSLMFVHKISTRVVCVNCRHPWSSWS